MATPSLEQFMKTIQEAGLPMGTSRQGVRDMRTANPLSRFAIEPLVAAEYQPALDKLTGDRAAKVQKLADMDSRLKSLYGQGGKLQTNNPMLLEQALSTGTDIVAGEAGLIDQEINNTIKEAEAKVNDIAKFYGNLITSKANALVGTGGGDGGSSNIDFEAELDAAEGLDLDTFTDEELDAILNEAGIIL